MEKKKQSYLKIEERGNAYLVLLWTILATIFTGGLLFPLAIWYINKYFIPKKYIDDRQLSYNGKLIIYFLIIYVGAMLVLICVWTIELVLKHYNLIDNVPAQLLNAIPGLLGTLLINIHISRYTQQSTHFADTKDQKSGFKFKLWLFLGKYILTKIIAVGTAWLLYPISSRLSVMYDYKRGYIDGYVFSYKFSFRKMYPRYLLDVLLFIITIGFYLPALLIRRYESDQQFVHISGKLEEKEK